MEWDYLQRLSQIPVYFLAAIALSVFLTKLCIIFLPYFKMVDIPRGRHQHTKAVPVGGGTAIIFSFAIVMACLILNHPQCIDQSRTLLLQFGPPMAIITILGILDDRFELSSIAKLLVQIVIGIYFFFTGAEINNILGYTIPAYFALPITVCWIIGIINAFNLIDGMDGVAAGLAAISAFSMAVWMLLHKDQVMSVFCLMIFCGSCLGFLRYNFSPAKIFMGDTGSMFIGMFFAYFSITESAKSATLTSLLVPVLAMGIPLFDVFLAITRRLYRKYIMKMPDVGIMTGDHDHLHHRLQEKLQNPRKTAYYLYMLAIMLAVGAMSAALLSDLLKSLSFGILLIVIFVMVRSATIEFYDATSLIANGIRLPHRKFILTALHPVIDIVLLATAYVLTSFIFQRKITFSPFTLKQALCYIAPYPIILSLSGIYRTYWMRVGITRFYRLGMMLVVSSVAVLALVLGFILLEFGLDRDQISMMREFFSVYALLGSVFIIGECFVLHYLESFGFKCLEINLAMKERKLPRTLIYGGGLYCRMLLIYLHSGSNLPPSRKVIGLLDDNNNLRGLNVYGMNVMGGFDDLPQILKKHPFEEIVIAFREITPEMRQKITAFGKANGIAVREVHYDIETLLEK